MPETTPFTTLLGEQTQSPSTPVKRSPEDIQAESIGQALMLKSVAYADHAPRPTSVDIHPTGTRYSKYDAEMTNPESRYDLEEFRANRQTTGDKIGNGLVKLGSQLGSSLVGGTFGTAYGLANVIHKKELSAFYNNSAFEGLNRWDQSMQEAFPHYYTRKEQELGFGSLGTVNFWADQFLNGLGFMAGAVLTEVAVTWATAGLGSELAATGLAARMKNLSGVARATSRLRNLSRATHGIGGSLDDLAQAEGWLQKTASGLAQTGRVGRQLLTGAGYESAVESMHTYESMSERIIADRFEGRFDAEEKAMGRPLTLEEKRARLTPEEKKGIHDSVVDVTNLVFAGNMMLVGGSNMITLGKWFRPKFLSNTTSKLRPTSVMDDLLLKRAGQDTVRNIRAGGSYLSKLLSESGQEMGQGMLNRWGDEYAINMASPDNGTWDLLKDMWDHVGTEEWARFTSLDPDMVKEGLLGALVAGVGLPLPGHWGASSDIQEADAHMDLYHKSRKAELDRLRTALTRSQEADPSVMNNLRQLITMYHSILGRADAQKAAAERGDVFEAKNFEEDDLIDNVLYHLETGALDDMRDNVREMESMSPEEFSKTVGFSPDLSREEIVKRRSELVEKSRRMIDGVTEATRKVDEALRLSPEERYLNTLDVNSKAFKRRLLIRALVTEKESQAREKKLVEEIKELTGGRIKEVADEVDTLEFGDGQELRIGEMPSGSSPEAVLADIRNRKMMLSTIPIGERTAVIQAELNKLISLEKSLGEHLNSMSAAEVKGEMKNSTEDLMLKEWMVSDPINSTLHKDLGQKLKDVRKLRMRRHQAIETLQALMDPEMAKARISTIQKVAEKTKAKEAAAVSASEKQKKDDATVQRIKEFKEKARSYKKLLSSELEKVTRMIQDSEQRLASATETHLALQQSLAKMDKAGWKTINIKLLGEKIRLSREELETAIAIAEEDLATAKAEMPNIETLRTSTVTDLNEMMRILELIEGQDPELAKELWEKEVSRFQPEAIEASKWLTESFEEYEEEVELPTGKISVKRLRPIPNGFLRSVAQGMSERLGAILDAAIEEVTEKISAMETLLETAKAALKVNVDPEKFQGADAFTVNREEIDGIRQALDMLKGQLDDLRKQKKRNEEYGEFNNDIGYNAVRFLEMLARLEAYDPVEEIPESKLPPTEELVEMGETMDEDSLKRKDITDIISTTGRILSKEDLSGPGAMETYTRLLPGFKSKSLSPAEIKEFKIAESQLDWNHWQGSGIQDEEDGLTRFDTSYSLFSNGKVVGNGLLLLHQGNVQALPEEIRSELSQYLYDETSVLTVLVVSKDGRFHLYRNEEGRPLLTHLATDSLTDGKGTPRYTNKRDLPAEEYQARSAAFRKEVLSNPKLMVAAIAGKGTGTINLDDKDRKASETVTGNLADVHLAFVTPVAELEEDKVPTKKVGNMKLHDKVDPAKKRVLGEIRVLSSRAKGRLGTIWAYDHVRRFLVPMRRQRHDEQSSREIMSLFAKQISIYNEEIEKGGSVTNARQAVKSHMLTTKDGETNLYALTEDLIETVHQKSKWHLHLRLNGKEAVVTYGEAGEAVSLNDILDMNEAGRGLQQFLMTKFRNVNKATSESGVTLIDKDKNGRQLFANQKRYKAQKAWTYVRLDERTLEPKYSESFKSYNEFVLKGVKGGTPSLMTHAVPYRTTKENPRSFGGYLVLRATTSKAPGFAIQTLDNEFESVAPVEEKKNKDTGVDGIKVGQEQTGRLTGKKEEVDPNLVGDDLVSQRLNADLNKEAITGEQESIQEPSDDEIVMVDRSGKGSPDTQTVKISTGKKTVTVTKGELMIVPTEGRVTIGAFVDGMPVTIGTVTEEGAVWEIPQLGSSAALLESWAKDVLSEDDMSAPFMQFLDEPAQDPTEREKEIAEANRMTPLEVRMIKGFLTSMDGPAQAQLISHGRVLLSRLSQPGAIFHEAFHNIELYVLSPSDRAKVYSKVRSRPGQTVTFRGETKDMPMLTDKECSEWLAEEFRKTTLDPDRKVGEEDKVSLIQKAIRFIRNLVRTLLGLNEELVQDSGMMTLEEFFKGIRTGKFNIPARSNPAPEMSDMKLFNGTTVRYTKDMVDMMMTVVGEMPEYINSLPLSARPESFRRLFSIYDIYNVLRKGTPEEANFLGTVRWEMLQKRLDTLPKGSVERANLERALREISDGKRLHVTLIGDRIRELLEIKKEKRGKEEEEDERKDQIEEGKENWQIEEDEVSVLKKVPPVVKLLLATLPSGKRNSTGLEGAVPLSEVLRVLGHELDGKHSLQEILEHLRIMDEGQLPDPEKGLKEISPKRHRYPWLKELRERLGDGFDPAMPYGQVQLLAEFSRKFYTVTHDPALPMITPEGTVYISDPAYERAAWKIKLKWRTNLLTSGQRIGYVSESGEGLVFNSTRLFQAPGMGGTQRSLSDIQRSLMSATSSTGDISFELKALALLGIRFTSPERVEDLINSGQQDEFSAAVKAIFTAVTKGEGVSMYDRASGSSVASRFNYLIRLEMMTSGEPVGKTFWNANNRMQFTSQRPNVLGIVMSMKERMGRWLDPQRNRWVHGSVLLDHLLSGNMRIVSVEGLRPQAAGEVGDKVTKLNKTDLYVSYISALLGNVLLSPRAADQASEVAFSIGGFGERESLNTVLGDRDTILKGYLLGEMLAIHAAKNRLHLKDFKQKGQKLRFFSSMLLPISVSRIEEAALGLEEKDFERFLTRNWKTFSKEINEALKGSAKETMEDMVKEGVFVEGKDPGIYSTPLDLSKLTDMADLRLVEGSQGNRLWGRDRVLALAEELEWRKFVSNVEFFKLFGGDPAFYKALLKRIKVLMGGRTPMEMDPGLQEWARVTSHGPLHVQGNMARAIVVKEPSTRTPAELVASISEVASAFAAQKYAKGGDSSDGTMIVNLDTYRYMQLSASLWSQAKEDAYQRLRLSRNERSYENGGSFVPDKFIYAGPAEFAEDMEALGVTMFKMSVVPIWSDLAFVGDEMYPNIQSTLDFMEREKAAFIVMPSAVKVGSPDTDVQTSYMSETGQMVFDRIGTGSIIDVDLRFMSSQVKVSSFSKGKVATAVQMRVHAESDMYDGGLPHMLPQEGERDPYEVTQEYVAVMEALTELRKEKLMNTLGIVQTPEGYLFDPSKRKALEEFLDEELENKDLDHTVRMSLQRYLDSLPEDEPFRLDMVMNSRDLEGMLFSAASKKVVKAKVAGEMMVLQSDFGFEYVRKMDGTEGPSRLKFYREKDENGRQFMSMEVYLPHRFKELLPIGDAVLVDSPKGKVLQIRGKDGQVIKEMTPVETHQILQMVGTRIPTDGLHSMEVLRVKGFLPQEAGPRVIVPGELVIKAGCDFDIDKLTMYFKDLGFNVNKDGKISLRVDEYYTSPEDWFMVHQSKAQQYLESAVSKLTALPGQDQERVEFEKAVRNDQAIKTLLRNMLEEAGLNLEDDLSIGILLSEDLQDSALSSLPYKLRQLFDAEGRPYTFEEWSAMNPDASLKTINTTRSLHNRMIMLMAEMMAMKQRQSELFEPVNTSGLEEVAKEIQAVYDSKGNTSIPNLDSVSDLFSGLSLRAQVRVTKAYMEAKQTVGVFALHSTHHVKTQKSGLQVVPGKEVTIEFNGPQRVPMTLNFESTAGAPVEFGRLNGFNTPGQRDGERISRILSQLVNAAVDMVNTPLLHKLNISMDTAPVAVALVRAGVPLRTVALFLNQDSVKEFIRATSYNNSHLIGTVEDAMRQTGQLYSDALIRSVEKKYTAGDLSYGPLSDDVLKEMMGYTSETVPEELRQRWMEVQRQVLRDYLVYSELAQSLTDLTNGQAFDTKVPMSRAEAKLKRAKYLNVLNDGMFVAPEAVMTGGTSGSFMNGLDRFNSELGSLFDSMSPLAHSQGSPLSSIYDRMVSQMSRMKGNVDDQVLALTRVEQTFITFLLQRMSYRDNTGVHRPQDDLERLLFGKDSIAQRVSDIQNSDSNPLKDNLWLNSVLPVMSPTGSNTERRDANIYSYARYHKDSYEVSSAGDKRFSALYARLKDGRTVEEAYQLDIKGYREKGNDWRLGKGKPPLRPIDPKKQWEEYKALWETYLRENPKLKEELKEKAIGKVLTDKFASTSISQARALAEILNEELEQSGSNAGTKSAPKSQNSYLQQVQGSTVDGEDIYLYDSFMEIMSEDQRLARDLIHAAMLQAGTLYSPFNFTSMIPGELFTDIAMQAIRQYEMNGYSLEEGSGETWQEIYLTLMANLMRFRGVVRIGGRKRSKNAPYLSVSRKINHVGGKFRTTLYVEEKHLEFESDWSEPVQLRKWKILPSSVTEPYSEMTRVNSELLSMRDLRDENDRDDICTLVP